MLTQIFVKDFILMDNVSLNFHPLLSAFTGETGAGKSLLMDAIGILKGDRVNSGMVKEGKEKAIIEGVFEINSNHDVITLLEEGGFTLEEGTLIVTREISKDGKSIARINQRVTTVAFVREVVSNLIDLHSQHDTQYLLNAKCHLSLLDNFCQDQTLLKEVKEHYLVYKKVSDDLKDALLQDYNEDDLEFLTFQLHEIDSASIEDKELETLEQKQKAMMAYEKISSKIQIVGELLEGEQGGTPKIYEAHKELASIHEDEQFAIMSEKLLDSYYVLEDVLSSMNAYLDGMEYDEQVYNELQDRIFSIHKLFRKYGGDYRSLQEKREELERKIDSILHRQEFISKHELIKQETYQEYEKLASKLHFIRKQKSEQLEKLVLQQLHDLELRNAKFTVAFQESEGNATGTDKVEFLISMNAGERLKSLSTTASGGELSRFMLGLKTVFTRLQGIDTVIFDEIDTGVSGSVAFAIGKKMQELASNTQVFCVTHLAAVAACADQHYIVEKTQNDHSTKTDIRRLNETERIEHLAGISSNSQSQSAKEAAKELITLGKRSLS